MIFISRGLCNSTYFNRLFAEITELFITIDEKPDFRLFLKNGKITEKFQNFSYTTSNRPQTFWQCAYDGFTPSLAFLGHSDQN